MKKGFCVRRRLMLAGLAFSSLARADETRLQVLLEEFPPYSTADAQGQPAGYSVDLVREMLARAKVEAQFEFSSWTRVFMRGRSEANVLLPAIVRLAEREAQFHWLGSIATRRGMLFRLKSRPEVNPHSLAEAKTWRIGVIKEDVSERELLALGLELGQQLDRSSDYPGLLRRFFAGRNDLLAVNQAHAPAILKQYGYDVKLIEPVLKFSESRPSMALSLQTPDALRHKLQQAFDGMRRDGTLAAIAARYPVINLE